MGQNHRPGMIIPLSRWAGRFRLAVYRPDGRLRQHTGWLDNLVTDAGLNRIGLGSFMTHCLVGYGNTTPAVTDGAMESPSGSTTTIITATPGASDTAPYYGYRRALYSFPAGAVSGNLAEVGVGWDTGLFSRALIVDAYGDPAVITVIPGDILNVQYEIRNYAPTADASFSVVIADIERLCTVRAANATSGSTVSGWGVTGEAVTYSGPTPIVAYDGAMGAVTGQPSGVQSACSNAAAANYLNNSFERGISATWIQAYGNFATGISSLFLPTSGLGAYQLAIDPPIAKNAFQQLSLTLAVGWGRP